MTWVVEAITNDFIWIANLTLEIEILMELWGILLLLCNHRNWIELVVGMIEWCGMQCHIIPFQPLGRKNIPSRFYSEYVLGSRRWDFNTLPWWSGNCGDLGLHQKLRRRFEYDGINHRRIFGAINYGRFIRSAHSWWNLVPWRGLVRISAHISSVRQYLRLISRFGSSAGWRSIWLWYV